MNLPYTYIPNLIEQVPDIPADSIISRTVYSDDRLKTILFAFAPGQELSEHTSAKMAILHFLQGEAELTLGADRMMVGAGAWVQLAPHLPHSIIAKTPVLMLLLMFQ
jgi:quercetin dioxygenase-like cupin family protein